MAKASKNPTKVKKPTLLRLVQAAHVASRLCPQDVARKSNVNYSSTHDVLQADEHRGLITIERLLEALRPALWKVIQADLEEALLEAETARKEEAARKPEDKFMEG